MTGMPPPTAASKERRAPDRSARVASSKTVRREHRLIRGDDGDAARKRGLDGVQRDPFGAADQLDENVDIRGGCKLRRRWRSKRPRQDRPLGRPCVAR